MAFAKTLSKLSLVLSIALLATDISQFVDVNRACTFVAKEQVIFDRKIFDLPIPLPTELDGRDF